MSHPEENRLLAKLAAADFQRIEPMLEDVSLTIGETIEEPQTPIEAVVFPESGIVSVVAVSAAGERLEVGLIGREGMTGSVIVMGSDRSPHHSFVQMSGSGRRMAAADLRRAMADSPPLQALLMRYVQTFSIQTAHTALANGRSKLEERLSRWLLMCHDRTDGDELPMTHEFLSLMLGVRRSGVTVALHMLEGNGLIRATRGKIEVVDRDGLIANCGGA